MHERIPIGSKWISSNRGHPPNRFEVVGHSTRSVKILCTTNGSHQHKGRIYTIPHETFLSRHRRLS